MEREKLNLTKKQGQEIVSGDSREFKTIEDKIIENGRWTLTYEIVIQRKSDNKFFSDTYRRGATESQEERPYEFDAPTFKEVFPVEKTITVYE